MMRYILRQQERNYPVDRAASRPTYRMRHEHERLERRTGYRLQHLLNLQQVSPWRRREREREREREKKNDEGKESTLVLLVHTVLL